MGNKHGRQQQILATGPESAVRPQTGTRSTGLSIFFPYFPILKMTFGSLALVLVASFAIRLSPLLLDYIDPDEAQSDNAGSLESWILPHPALPPVEESRQVSPPAAAVQLPLSRGFTLKNALDRSSEPVAPTAGYEPQISLSPTSRLAWEKSEEHAGNAIFSIGALADLSSLTPKTSGHPLLLPVAASRAPDHRFAAPQNGSGFAHRFSEGSILVGRSLARSGKSTAVFFSKLGSTIKRGF
ncbi:MAG TPA: hypothetical protein VE398_22395 [Acidobacteriota bacterium]|nr:hypothetical protein [Acidobacteriota bacterium]